MGKRHVLFSAVLVSVLLALTACGGSTGGGGAAERAQQVAAGQAVYRDKCLACHGENLQGVAGPALNATTLSRFSDGKAMFDYISKNMPMSAPASLSQDQYLQAEAYILDHINVLPADQKLTTDNAAGISLKK
jgi:mono/diheme cytochrome c family protein